MAYRKLVPGIWLCTTCFNPSRLYTSEEAWVHGDGNTGHLLKPMRLYAFKRELEAVFQ